MLDKESPLGRLYETKKNESKFYKYARFYSVKQVLEYLSVSGYAHSRTLQTIFHNPEAITAIEPVKEGYGEGLFVSNFCHIFLLKEAESERICKALFRLVTLIEQRYE